MLDIKFVRENPEAVKENIKKKFQNGKLPLVDEVIALDKKSRETQKEADDLRANRNRVSKEIGALMAQGKKEEAQKIREQVARDGERIKELEQIQHETADALREKMLVIPQMIDPSVPIGENATFNVEGEDRKRTRLNSSPT